MPTFRATYFKRENDKAPARTDIIDAHNTAVAAKKATALIGDCERVDVTRTILKSRLPASPA